MTPHNDLIDRPTYSLFSRPLAAEHASYAIHLVKADDPAYIPADFEVWPLYHQAILEVLREHPLAHDAAVEAVRKTSEELRGLQNRALPPGSAPGW